MKASRFFCTACLLPAILLSNIFPALAQVSASPRPYREVLVKPDHSDWTYLPGETCYVHVYAYAGGRGVDSVEVSYEIGEEQQAVESKGRCMIINGEALIDCGTMSKPGFRNCQVQFICEGKLYKENVKVAYAPEQIKARCEMPSDFDKFWEKQLRAGSKIPMEPQLWPLPEQSTDKVEVSLVRLQCGETGRFIYGYLCKPRKEGKFPVLMVPPGAGVKRVGYDKIYPENDFITLSIDIHGVTPLADDSTMKFFQKKCNEYMYQHMENPGSYYYRNVYLACVRAIDYLCSLPEWDGVNVGVTGGSQGGALSIVTAALDSRVDFLAAYYPALCDMVAPLYGQAGGWPKNFTSSGLSKLPVDIPTAIKTLSYYDVVNFARKIQVNGFYSFGYNDNTCPPTSVYAAINAITAPKKIVVTPISGHWRFGETNLESVEWMKAQCQTTQQ